MLSAASDHAQLRAGAGVPPSLVHGLDMTFGIAGLFGLAALVLVALLVRLPAAGPEAALAVAPAASDGPAPAEEYELVDGEGFEWPDPELVA